MPYPFPRSASDLIILNEFKNTFRGEPFGAVNILYGSGQRTIIFSSRRNLNSFPQSSSIYFDVIFKTIPQIFSQLFTIHGTNFTTTVPYVCPLMQRKKKTAYDTV
ncbi:hypothetical protein HZS_5617 [Henneguya salminicola]|nr:hypothetical protein HZS_5617 [Henneguya salminicola]